MVDRDFDGDGDGDGNGAGAGGDGTGNGTGTGDGRAAPQTGDTLLPLWLAIVLASEGALCLCAWGQRRRGARRGGRG